jgi:hypothetical protein
MSEITRERFHPISGTMLQLSLGMIRIGDHPITGLGKNYFEESAVEKKLPAGYDWRIDSYGDDEGIVITVTLVSSTYKPGSWMDRVFGRKILNSSCEAELDAEEEEINAKVEEMKAKITSVFFNWN